jgi:hypothetical protein
MRAQTSDVVAQITREWEELNQNLRLDGAISLRKRGTSTQFIAEIDTDYTMKLLGNEFLAIEKNFLDDSRHVTGINESYVFELIAKNDSPFVIDDLNELSEFDDRSFKSYRNIRQYRQRHPSLEFFKILGWPTILASKGLVIRESRDIEWNGKSALEVGLNCEPPPEEFDPRINTDQSKLVPKIRNCRVVFLKDFNFLPAEWECKMKLFPDADFTPIKVVLDYDFESFDVPFPTKRTQERTYKGVNDVETIEYSYDFNPPDEREFYVSAFGLPEPPFARKQGFPNVVWFVLGGLILFAFGMFILRRAKG